jgi:DNA (cytosine-5)-methyltransferase 1
MERLINMERIKVASLFCGCGGMDLGINGGFEYLENHYEELPFEVVYAADNDLYAARIYNDNFQHKCELKDVRDIVPEKLPDHDLLLGGFPCQSFSISAQNPPRLGYKDERGKLFFEMINVLKVKQPRFFIAENVKGLLSANKGKAFPMIVKEFENAGYYVKHNLFDSSEFGIPQKRQRVFIVGFKNYTDFAYFNFPNPITLNGSKVKLKEVIDSEANKNEKWFFSQRAVEGMLKVKDKMNKGRAQNLEQPCNTISSHLAKVSLNSTDPVLMINERYRRFTPREAANIQSFPDSFKLDSVSDNRQYRAIGNAVPPVLMWHVGRALTRVLEQDSSANSHTHWQVTQSDTQTKTYQRV